MNSFRLWYVEIYIFDDSVWKFSIRELRHKAIDSKLIDVFYFDVSDELRPAPIAFNFSQFSSQF